MMTRREQVQLKAYKQLSTKRAADAVEVYIGTQCKALGYDNENSIAKYLVVGNDFYAECEGLSLWIGKVWTQVISIRDAVEAGSIPEPTHDELIAMLPVYE
mgnify:FL=1|jgi:hypothetical protein